MGGVKLRVLRKSPQSRESEAVSSKRPALVWRVMEVWGRVAFTLWNAEVAAAFIAVKRAVLGASD
jgi:hypothetical protein